MKYPGQTIQQARYSIVAMHCHCCGSAKIIAKILDQRDYHKCVSCGHTWGSLKTNNLLKSILSEHYQEVDPYQSVAAAKQSFFRASLEYLDAEIKNGNRAILDVGCGFGHFLEHASRNGWEAYGVELVDAAAQGARERLGEGNIFHGTLDQAHFADASFDAVTLWDVLVLVDNLAEQLKECYRILKRSGKIGIRVRNVIFQKNTYQLYRPFKIIASRLQLKKPYVFHRHNFTPESLHLLLKRAGFRNVQVANSPLTEGDPYSLVRIRKLTSTTKSFVELVAGSFSAVTKGRFLVGPSLLAWAEKPR